MAQRRPSAGSSGGSKVFVWAATLCAIQRYCSCYRQWRGAAGSPLRARLRRETHQRVAHLFSSFSMGVTRPLPIWLAALGHPDWPIQRFTTAQRVRPPSAIQIRAWFNPTWNLGGTSFRLIASLTDSNFAVGRIVGGPCERYDRARSTESARDRHRRPGDFDWQGRRRPSLSDRCRQSLVSCGAALVPDLRHLWVLGLRSMQGLVAPATARVGIGHTPSRRRPEQHRSIGFAAFKTRYRRSSCCPGSSPVGNMPTTRYRRLYADPLRFATSTWFAGSIRRVLAGRT